MKYKTVVCGGTFDYFHKGHEMFLRFVLSQADNVLLGITSDAFLTNEKKVSQYQDYNIRKKAVETFLKHENASEKVKILPIDSLFLPKEWEQAKIDVIIVTSESVKGAKSINEKRVAQHLIPLAIITAPLYFADNGEIMSSSLIRSGKVNRDGNEWILKEWNHYDRFITEELRLLLAKPWGKVFSNMESLLSSINLDSQNIACVGDCTTKKLNELFVKQKISVVDFRIARKKAFSTFLDLGFLGNEKVISVDNPAGSLTWRLFAEVQLLFDQYKTEKRFIMMVNGEEDLVVLPLILASPLGFCIIYGQPNKGTVLIVVTGEYKKKAYDAVRDFIRAGKNY